MNALFLKIADKISYGMGTPANIMFWLVAVIVWVLLGALNSKLFTGSNFLPAWFISTGWNFPLNIVTTVLELYIGFFVAAASNRSERNLENIINHVNDVVTKFEIMEENQSALEQKILDMEQNILQKIEDIK